MDRTSGSGPEDRRTPDDQRAADGTFWAGGTVTAVDAAAGTVTIAGLRKGESDSPETIEVAADAAITVDKVSGTLAGLPVGARALITGTIDEDGTASRTATRIDATTSWPLRLGGAVVSVGSGTLTLNEHDKTVITVAVGPAVLVTVDGRASSLAGLPAGARVWVEGTVTATSQTVTKVEARMPAAERVGGGTKGGATKTVASKTASNKTASSKKAMSFN